MLENWKKAWSLFEVHERRRALFVLAIMMLSGIMSAVMVASIMPFLHVLANSAEVESISGLERFRDYFGLEGGYSLLLVAGVASIGTIVVATGLQMYRVKLVSEFVLNKSHLLAERILRQYLSKPYEYFLNRNSEEIGAEILSETTELVERFLRPAAEILAASWSIVMITAFLLWFDPLVTLTVFGVMTVLLGLLFRFTRKKLSYLAALRATSNKERFRVVGETFDGIKVVKLASAENFFLDRFMNPSKAMASASVSSSLISQIPGYAIQAIAFGGTIILSLALTNPEAVESRDAVGNLLPLLGVYAFAGQRLLPEFNRVYFSMSAMRFGSQAITAVHAALNSNQFPTASPKKIVEDEYKLDGDIEIQGLEYRYPGAASNSLQIDKLTILKGETIGVVGATGSGKTTFADVLLGLLTPDKGQLTIGKASLNRHQSAWRRNIGYVPQDIFLRDASITENIAFGVNFDEIDRDRVRSAASVANLDSFICTELPSGYDTQVGEKGVRLSGGQKQRLGIARALYHNANIIVFDEATSALDTVTEDSVMSAISALSGQKTLILIAHRLSTLKACNRIIMLKEGRIIAVGTWDELVSRNEDFREFARRT